MDMVFILLEQNMRNMHSVNRNRFLYFLEKNHKLSSIDNIVVNIIR